MSQVHEGEVQLAAVRAGLGRDEQLGDASLPLRGAVPHLHQAIILNNNTVLILLFV